MNNKILLDRSPFTLGIMLALGLSFGLSQTALADTASDDLQINAGLIQALTLSCDTALSFGITRLDTLDRSPAITKITLDPTDDTLSISAGSSTGVSTGTGQAGVCTVTGSAQSDSSLVTVNVGGEQQAPGDASVDLEADGDAFTILDPPTEALSLTVDNFQLDDVFVRLTDGEVTFKLGADLTIPAVVAENNLGGYSNTISVFANDGFSEGE